ncbi:hypothetical protein [Schauerella aestuarii]|uniref:hypothetical protein n=1 Tax=Schauerella aestuarii TaxID=2511204 RepID=UPI00136FC5AC|nr:hypothetical protein [Achromobacter aestuarii]MYZ41400.1 hypothetical protein [Achromobacter aestuarii]
MISCPKNTRLRSEKHRRNVASLACVKCGLQGFTQAAHANFGKGLGLKACDSQLMALCVNCHRHHDSGGMNRDLRRRQEVQFIDLTRAELIARSLWTPEIEQAYRVAYEPLKRAAA